MTLAERALLVAIGRWILHGGHPKTVPDYVALASALEAVEEEQTQAEDTEETLRLTREEFARHMVEWNTFKERAEAAEARLRAVIAALTKARSALVESEGPDGVILVYSIALEGEALDRIDAALRLAEAPADDDVTKTNTI